MGILPGPSKEKKSVRLNQIRLSVQDFFRFSCFFLLKSFKGNDAKNPPPHHDAASTMTQLVVVMQNLPNLRWWKVSWNQFLYPPDFCFFLSFFLFKRILLAVPDWMLVFGMFNEISLLIILTAVGVREGQEDKAWLTLFMRKYKTNSDGKTDISFC